MSYLNFNDKNVSVTIPYQDLQRMMEECVTTTMKKVEVERKKMENQKWFDTTHTAQMFGVNVCTINRWKHSGYLTARTVGGRDFFHIDEINQRLTINPKKS